MKKLILLRHGQSPHPENISDHQRPVRQAAARQIAATAERLREQERVPDRVLSSDALRAAQTAEAFCEAAHCKPPVMLRDLYGAPAQMILQAIRQDGGKAAVLMVVGHNPGLEECCDMLAPESLPGGRLRTGAMAVFSLDIQDWQAVTAGRAKLEQVIESH